MVPVTDTATATIFVSSSRRLEQLMIAVLGLGLLLQIIAERVFGVSLPSLQWALAGVGIAGLIVVELLVPKAIAVDNRRLFLRSHRLPLQTLNVSPPSERDVFVISGVDERGRLRRIRIYRPFWPRFEEMYLTITGAAVKAQDGQRVRSGAPASHA